MQTVQLKKRAQDFGAKFSAFCDKHEGKINLACNIGAYSLGATILAKTTTLAGVLAGTTLVVIGTVGIAAQGIAYLSEVRRPGDDKAVDVALAA